MTALRICGRINDWAGNAAMVLAMVLLVYMVGHILVEIVLRSAFATSTYSMDEFVGYAVGAMTFLSLAYTFRKRRHIRVNLLRTALTGRLATAAEVACILMTFAITLFLTRYVWRMLARDYGRGTVSPTLNEFPIWIIEAVIFAGLVLFLMQLVASLIETLHDGPRDDEAFGD